MRMCERPEPSDKFSAKIFKSLFVVGMCICVCVYRVCVVELNKEILTCKIAQNENERKKQAKRMRPKNRSPKLKTHMWAMIVCQCARVCVPVCWSAWHKMAVRTATWAPQRREKSQNNKREWERVRGRRKCKPQKCRQRFNNWLLRGPSNTH